MFEYNAKLEELINNVNYNNEDEIIKIENYFRTVFEEIKFRKLNSYNSKVSLRKIKNEIKIYNKYYKLFHKKILNALYLGEKYKKVKFEDFELTIKSGLEDDEIDEQLKSYIKKSNDDFNKIRSISNPIRHLINLLYEDHIIDFNTFINCMNLTFDANNNLILQKDLIEIVKSIPTEKKKIIYVDLLFMIKDYNLLNGQEKEDKFVKNYDRLYKDMDVCNKKVQNLLVLCEVKNHA